MDESPYLSLVPEWEHDEEETLVETRIFTLRRRRGRSTADTGRFVYLDSADWVNVVAVTDDGEVVLIEQFRHGLARVTLEIPGGIVDPGEDALDAGLRELREETGYGGGDARLIGRVSPNPAIQNNWCHTLHVDGVSEVDVQALEGHEEIGVRLEPIERIPDLIRDGLIHHALVVAAFQHFWLRDP